MNNEEITEKFFDMLAKGEEEKEVTKKLGIKKVETDVDCDEIPNIITIYYPDGAIISHWV